MRRKENKKAGQEEEGGGGRDKGKDRSRSSRQPRANSKTVMQAPGQAEESREGGTPTTAEPTPTQV